MIIARLMFAIGVLLFAYSLALVGNAIPLLGAAAIGACVFYVVKGARKRLTTLGSARWAGAEDLSKAGMFNAKAGVILGRLADNRRHFLSALRALWSPMINSMTACLLFVPSQIAG